MQFNTQTLSYSDVLIPFEQKVYETQPDLDEEKSLELASILFFEHLNLDFNINDDPDLTTATVDKLALVFLNRFFDREIGFETERKFKMKLKSILLARSGYYSRRFSISFRAFLDGNVSFKKTYEKNNEMLANGESTSTGSGSSTTENNSTGKTTAERETADNGTQADNNFNRDLQLNTPGEQLSLTGNPDGSGVINRASFIEENKAVNSQTKTNTQNLTGEENTEGTETGTGSYESEDAGTTKQTGESKELYDDTTEGYDFRTNSQGKVYNEYISSLSSVFDEILDECDKCFLQIWI